MHPGGEADRCSLVRFYLKLAKLCTRSAYHRETNSSAGVSARAEFQKLDLWNKEPLPGLCCSTAHSQPSAANPVFDRFFVRVRLIPSRRGLATANPRFACDNQHRIRDFSEDTASVGWVLSVEAYQRVVRFARPEFGCSSPYYPRGDASRQDGDPDRILPN